MTKLEIAIKGSGPPYVASSKQPDQYVLPADLTMPTIVIESGWSEPAPMLHQDMRLWLRGGGGRVKVVLLFKWDKIINNRVEGRVEVYDLDAVGIERLIQTEVAIDTFFDPVKMHVVS